MGGNKSKLVQPEKLISYRTTLLTALTIVSKLRVCTVKDLPQDIFMQETGKTLAELGVHVQRNQEFACCSKVVITPPNLKKLGSLTDALTQFINNHVHLKVRATPRPGRSRVDHFSSLDIPLIEDPFSMGDSGDF
ncbi:MAG: hypothetical protein ABIJ10_01530 [Candidatus Micrarchaeota archaeon]